MIKGSDFNKVIKKDTKTVSELRPQRLITCTLYELRKAELVGIEFMEPIYNNCSCIIKRSAKVHGGDVRLILEQLSV